VSEAGGVMGGDHNSAILISPEGAIPWPRLTKHETAARLVAEIAWRLHA
jgi:phosphopantothenoylcysteine decarboxylase / phosphopantothenate---cysteine ligase